jgi:peptide/nickel transport system permease protein
VIKYIAFRIVQMAIIFVIFLTILFGMLHAQPGDITNQLVGDPRVPPEARVVMADRLGLNEPFHRQYFNYVTNFFRGNLGVSFSHYPRNVTDILIERAPRTLFLFLTATLTSYGLGYWAGKYLAWKRGRLTEHAVNITGVTLYTVFQPWFYLMMIYLFAFILGIFPTGGFIDHVVWRNAPYRVNEVFHHMLLTMFLTLVGIAVVRVLARRLDHPRTRRLVRWGGTGVVLAALLAWWVTHPMYVYAADIVWHTVLPVFTLTLVIFGGAMLLMRSSMLETLREDYVFTARAKGLPERVVRDRHAARNALLPMVTSFLLALAFVIGGGIIAENIFSWPGMGLTLLQAAEVGDIPLATGALAFIGLLALIAHLVVDIVYMYLDPRIRH